MNNIKKPLQIIIIIFVSIVILSPAYIYHQNIEEFLEKYFISRHFQNFSYNTYVSIIYAFLSVIVLFIITDIIIFLWKMLPFERDTGVRIIKIKTPEKRGNIEDYAEKK